VSFGRTVTQGLFTEGWRLPWEYLAQSEGGFGLAIVGLLVGMLASVLRRREPLPPRVIGAMLAIAAIYALLVLFSCVLTRFVVYGRTVKPLVPALCLLGGWALTRLLASRPSFRPFAATVLVLIGVLRFWPHFAQVFPRDVEVSVLRAWGNPKHALTISGSIYAPLNLPVARPDFALLNAEMLYPVRARLEAPAGVTLLRFEHPLSYPPYQYEGHTPRERELLRTTDVSIRLVRLADPASVPDNPPPAAWFHAADRPTGR
ncbi:MAG: hypothetical protein NTV51_16305, partial [Verrucomicrobia bacterium]|nr:hypothetical protein [Verrucomicrobiota bacterium]